MFTVCKLAVVAASRVALVLNFLQRKRLARASFCLFCCPWLNPLSSLDVLSTNNNTQVKAEGRRNKVPLEKGFSQVSWMKLTKSGQDLTGGLVG